MTTFGTTGHSCGRNQARLLKGPIAICERSKVTSHHKVHTNLEHKKKSEIAQTRSWRYKTIVVIKRQQQTTFQTNKQYTQGDWAEEFFKRSKEAALLQVWILKRFWMFRDSFFCGWRHRRGSAVGFCFFAPCHRALGPNRKRQLFSSSGS